MKRILPRYGDGDLPMGASVGAAIAKQDVGDSFKTGLDAAMRYVKNYYNSEGFRQRLDRTRNTEYKDSEYDDSPEIPYMYDIDTNIAPKIGVIIHTPDKTMINNGEYNPELNWIRIGRQTNRDYDTVAAHELGHLYESAMIPNIGGYYSNMLPTLRNNIEYKKVRDYIDQNREELMDKWLTHPEEVYYDDTHDGQPKEGYADLVAARYWMNKMGIFDSTKKDSIFTEQLYNSIMQRNDLPFNVKRFFSNFKKKDAINAINNIAAVNTGRKLSPLQRQV